MTVKSKTTHVFSINVLHGILTNHNQVHCKENVKFYVSCVTYFEATLISENNFVLQYSLC